MNPFSFDAVTWWIISLFEWLNALIAFAFAGVGF